MNRLKKIGIVLGYVLLFAAIVVAILYAHIGARDHRESQRIIGFDIEIEGGGSHMLIDAQSMYRWFAKHGVSPKGKSIAEVSLATLEQVAMEHSAIANANAYISYDGRINMTITQREPIARLRVDGGYDHYIAADGVLFRATDGYAAYVPVITGDYKLLVDREFAGNINRYIEDSIVVLERRIVALEHEKYPIHSDRQRLKSRNRSVQDSVIKKPIWVSKEKYEERKADLEILKEAHQRQYEEQDAKLVKRLERLSLEQERLEEKIAMLSEVDADIRRFMEFIKRVNADSFWSAELTQVILTTGDKGNIIIEMVPRSGDFTIDLGDTHNLGERLQSVRTFYDKVLRNVGWDRYSRISVRYDGQVVCQPKKR